LRECRQRQRTNQGADEQVSHIASKNDDY